MRSGPITASAWVLVIHPVTASTCPATSGIMSKPMLVMVICAGSILFLDRIASSTKRAVGWMPMRLPIMSLTVRIGALGSE